MYNERNEDIVLSFAAIFQTIVLMLQLILKDLIILPHQYYRIGSITLSAIPMIIAMFYVLKREFLLFIYSYLIILSVISVTFIFFPDNKIYVKSGSFYLLCINLPSFLCIASIKDVYVLKKIIHKLSIVIFTLGIIYLFFIFAGKISFLDYSQTLSYYLLLPALFFLSQKNLVSTLFFITICCIMIIFGSRGALVSSIIYGIVILFLERKNKGSLVIIIMVVIILTSSFFGLFYSISNNLGITSRTLNLIQEGNFVELAGRNNIYSIIWKNIIDNPLWGYGIYGDRVILDGLYSHNIILEILINFGVFFGTILILLFFIKIVNITQNLGNENKKMLLLFICYGFIPLMVSESYLNDSRFGILIGSLYLFSKYESTEHLT